MTALKKYQRLEATALWRPEPNGQRREVVISIGDATLVICDLQDRALTHWSIAAVERLNPGALPACYAPNGDPGETLELAEEEAEMIDAVEQLLLAVERARPHPGRLRRLSLISGGCVLLAALAFWLPPAVERLALRTLPEVKAQQIGMQIMRRIEVARGAACILPGTQQALQQLAQRTGARAIAVIPALEGARALPGEMVLIGRALVEDFETPDVAAGYILAARSAEGARAPLTELLREGGILTAPRLLTRGEIAETALDGYTASLLARGAEPAANPGQLSQRFAAARISRAPFQSALDPEGPLARGLAALPSPAGLAPEPIMKDGAWVGLQSICQA